MKKLLLLLLVLIGISFSGLAQITNETNWQISYYGDVLINPGVAIGYQVPLKNWTSVKTKAKGDVSKYKSLNVGSDLIYYWFPEHHHGLILSPNVSYQRTKENGKYFQAKFSLGYHRSILDGTTYSVSTNDEVESKKFNGQGTLYNSLDFDFGKDLRVTKQKPFRWFFQIGLSGRTPYNNTYLPGIHTGFGIHYFISN